MSATLLMVPVVPVEGRSLPDALKFAMRNAYETPIDIVVSREDVPFFRGLLAANVKGAQEVIEAIEKHGVVRLYEQY